MTNWRFSGSPINWLKMIINTYFIRNINSTKKLLDI